MKKPPPGIYSVLPTPLDESGGVDAAGLRHIVRRLIDKKVHGLVALGSGGEFPYLTLDDKKKALDAAAAEAAGEIPVIAGAGAFGTDETIQIARHAEQLGLDALLAPLPIYFELKFESVLGHFRRLADAVPLPIVYYHFPGPTHLDLSADEIGRLFEIENLIGIKESTFNLNAVRKHIRALPEGAMVFAGTILMLRPVMKAGGCGCICPIPAIAPEWSVALYEALSQGGGRRAELLERDLFGLLPIFADVPLPAAHARNLIRIASELGIPVKMGGAAQASVKEALRLLGHPISPAVKSPLPPLTDAQRKKVRETLRRLKLLEGRDG